GVAGRPPVYLVEVDALELGPLGRHRAGAAQLLRAGDPGVGGPLAVAPVAVAAPAAEHHDRAGDERDDGGDRPVAAQRATPARRAGRRAAGSAVPRCLLVGGGHRAPLLAVTPAFRAVAAGSPAPGPPRGPRRRRSPRTRRRTAPPPPARPAARRAGTARRRWRSGTCRRPRSRPRPRRRPPGPTR